MQRTVCVKESEPALLYHYPLQDIDGSLFLYYNLCLCKFLKEHAPGAERERNRPFKWNGQASFAHAKVQHSLELAKLYVTFFPLFCTLLTLYIIYII